MKHIHTFETFVPKRSKERFKEPFRTILLNFDIDIAYNGEWYDGDTWEDGVPYVEGDIQIEAKDEHGATIAQAEGASTSDRGEYDDILWRAIHNLEEKLFGEYKEKIFLAIHDMFQHAASDHNNYHNSYFPLTKLQCKITLSADNYVVEADYIGMQVMDRDAFYATMPGDESDTDDDISESAVAEFSFSNWPSTKRHVEEYLNERGIEAHNIDVSANTIRIHDDMDILMSQSNPVIKFRLMDKHANSIKLENGAYDTTDLQDIVNTVKKLNSTNETFTPRKMDGRDDVKKEIYAKEIQTIDDFVADWNADKNHIYQTKERIMGECPHQGGSGLIEIDTQLQVTNITRTGDLQGTVTIKTEEEEYDWIFDLLEFAHCVKVSDINDEDKQIVVTTYGGEKTIYTDEDIQEMIDDIDMYWSADNLPKWMYAQKLVKNKQQALDVLKKILASTKTVSINVQSDAPNKNGINIFK